MRIPEQFCKVEYPYVIFEQWKYKILAYDPKEKEYVVGDGVMIESKTCQDCVKEIDNTLKKKLDEVISHRQQCKKCVGCERLSKIVKAAEKIEGGYNGS